MQIRNIAIIAHVDHGKTTLTDALMRQCGATEVGTSMDSNALERERGITIYSKNASVQYKGTKINVVDTPGHADFGSEVERVLRAIDTVLLVVDAQEGPMPQTRFVLKKSLELGLKPIVVINKIDKPAAEPARVEDQVLELFLELGASDEQAEFPVMYAIGREGVAKRKLTDESKDLSPLLDMILEILPNAATEEAAGEPLQFQPFNLGYDNFLGRMAIGRIYKGSISEGQQVFVKNTAGVTRKGSVLKLFSFEGLNRVQCASAKAGDIVVVSGIADIDIGETIISDESTPALPAIKVDEPTISLNFLVNNSPFAGREGKFVTSRQIRERLERELQVNVGLAVDFSGNDSFKVSGRGELHVAILLENMRREGYEIQVSQPEVIIKEIDGVTYEPYEEVTIDSPAEFQGPIIERLGQRGCQMTNLILSESGESVRLTFEGPTRGLLGYRSQFIVDTKGEGIFGSRFIEFRKFGGEIRKRLTGSMTCMIGGTSSAFALWNLQERGTLYIGPQVEVYEGMVIGNTSKGEEMVVNPIKGKQLTNVRSSGNDDAITLIPAWEITIERGLEIMNEDEYLEITPKSTRLRKQHLKEGERKRAGK
jgi:GTP-binding protein